MQLAILTALTALFVSSPADDYRAHLEAERSALREALIKACPRRAKEIAAVEASPDAKVRLQRIAALKACGEELEAYHLRLGAAHFAVKDFSAAEKSYRTALGIRVTESAQLGLLTALVRQSPRTPKQDADLREHFEYFRKRPCTRGDLCATLAYVAWHLEAHAITKRAADRAIAMDFPGWQPYFFGGTTYALGGAADREKARTWLREAKARGGPLAIDGFLRDLGAGPR